MGEKKERHRQKLVDKIRSEMTAEQLTEFDRMAQFRANSVDLWRLLDKWGYGDQCSLRAVQLWYTETYPKGDEAKFLNGLARAFQGLEIEPQQEMLFGKILKLLYRLSEIIDERIGKDGQPIATLDTMELIKALPGYLREARSLAGDIQNHIYIRDRAALELAGAEAVINELMLVFKDSAMESALKEACRGAIAKLEGRE